MARHTTFKRVLLLFSEENVDSYSKLGTVLESESDGSVEVVDLVDIQTRQHLTLEKELNNCDCIILVCSRQTCMLIDNEESSKFKVQGGIEVNFDGKVISDFLKQDGQRSKVIPVSFIELPKVLFTPGRQTQRGHRGHICFGLEQGKVITERMLEGEMLKSLIALIKSN